MFEAYRLDAEGTPDLASFADPRLGDGLMMLMAVPHARRVVLQAATGLSLLVRWNGLGSTALQILEIVDVVLDVSEALDPPANG